MNLPTLASPENVCQSCGQPAPTKYVEFYENVGALIMRFHRSVKGNLCKACIDAFFWNFTGKTIILGWWGIISLLVTPLILVNNVARFASSIAMKAPAARTGPTPSPFWIFTTIGAFLFMGWFVVSLFTIPSQSSQVDPTAQPQRPPATQRPSSTQSRPTSTTRPAPSYHGTPCTRWDQVTSSSVDSWICTYGIIYTYGPYSSRWNTIYFSDSATAFRVVDFNYFYSTPLALGDCVVAYGRVRDNGSYLVIATDKDHTDRIITTSATSCR